MSDGRTGGGRKVHHATYSSIITLKSHEGALVRTKNSPWVSKRIIWDVIDLMSKLSHKVVYWFRLKAWWFIIFYCREILFSYTMDMEKLYCDCQWLWLIYGKPHYGAAAWPLFYINPRKWRKTPFSCCWQQLFQHGERIWHLLHKAFFFFF